MIQKTHEQGFVTFAQNSETVNYLEQAYLLALSIKTTCKDNMFACIVDIQTAQHLQDKHYKVFDEVIQMDHMRPFENEMRLWELTPFKETIKIESDMLVTSSIDHWWYQLRNKNICFTHGVKNFRGQPATSRKYRALWDDNALPDLYNGLMYIRHDVETVEFFKTAQSVFDNYNIYRDKVLRNCRHERPDTDVVFGITSALLGGQHYIPNSTYPSFVHMKPDINAWPVDDWRDACSWALTDDHIFLINGYAQTYPVHYFEKSFCTQELIERYERVFQSKAT